uniref:Uncharacterized protein n=1 Tax=Arundo donax TaxID=35708 RepID=A0A0A9EX67_ARUDO
MADGHHSNWRHFRKPGQESFVRLGRLKIKAYTQRQAKWSCPRDAATSFIEHKRLRNIWLSHAVHVVYFCGNLT